MATGFIIEVLKAFLEYLQNIYEIDPIGTIIGTAVCLIIHAFGIWMLYLLVFGDLSGHPRKKWPLPQSHLPFHLLEPFLNLLRAESFQHFAVVGGFYLKFHRSCCHIIKVLYLCPDRNTYIHNIKHCLHRLDCSLGALHRCHSLGNHQGHLAHCFRARERPWNSRIERGQDARDGRQEKGPQGKTEIRLADSHFAFWILPLIFIWGSTEVSIFYLYLQRFQIMDLWWFLKWCSWFMCFIGFSEAFRALSQLSWCCQLRLLCALGRHERSVRL